MKKLLKEITFMILCLGMIVGLNTAGIKANYKVSAVDENSPIVIEEVAKEMGVEPKELFDLIQGLPGDLSELESMPVTYSGEEIIQQLELENGFTLVKTSKVQDVISRKDARYSSKRLTTRYFLKDPIGASTAVTLFTDLSYDQNMYSTNHFEQRITGISGRSEGYLYSITYNNLLPESSKVFSERPYAKQYFYAYFIYEGSPFHKTIINTIQFSKSGTYNSTWS